MDRTQLNKISDLLKRESGLLELQKELKKIKPSADWQRVQVGEHTVKLGDYAVSIFELIESWVESELTKVQERINKL